MSIYSRRALFNEYFLAMSADDNVSFFREIPSLIVLY